MKQRTGKLLIKVENKPGYDNDIMRKMMYDSISLNVFCDYYFVNEGISHGFKFGNEDNYHYIEFWFSNGDEIVSIPINAYFTEMIEHVKERLKKFKLRIAYVGRDVVDGEVKIPDDFEPYDMFDGPIEYRPDSILWDYVK